MAYPVSFGSIEKQYLVCLRDSLVVAEVAHVGPAVWKHEFCRRRMLLRAMLSTIALAVHIADASAWGPQQKIREELRNPFAIALRSQSLGDPTPRSISSDGFARFHPQGAPSSSEDAVQTLEIDFNRRSMIAQQITRLGVPPRQ